MLPTLRYVLTTLKKDSITDILQGIFLNFLMKTTLFFVEHQDAIIYTSAVNI